MKSWKKYLAATLAVAAISTAQVSVSEAAYELSSEVTTATAALKNATQLGVMTYENAAMANVENKDAILVMSFGTTYVENRKATIDATVEQIKAAHPGIKVVTAFTSHIVIDRIKANEGITYPTPEEALEQLKAEGYTRVAMTNLNIIPGVEYAYDLGVYQGYRDQFKKATFGTSLMYWQGQEEQDDDVTETMQALSTQFPELGENDGVLIMAHGTPHPANAYYAVMQARLNEMGHGDKVQIFSVEGWPGIDDVIPKMKEQGIKHITIMPMMMVAGDHANNDMAGDEEDSYKSILEKQGFTVDAYVHGMGENQAIRDLFVKRANAAWDALIAE